MSAPSVAALSLGGSLHLGEFLPALLVVSGYLLLYRIRARTLARRGRPVTRWRQAAFTVGVLIVAGVQLPPFDNIADQVLMAHMVQHLLLGDIASLLLVLGVTGPMVAPLMRLPSGRWLRRLTHPGVALVAWAVNSYAWRLPLLYQAALRHDLLHALEHASYVGFGILLWSALLGPMPKPAWFRVWPKLGYIVAVRFTGALLANVFIWAQTVFYPYYRTGDAKAGLNPLGDQNVAGAIMMLEQVILTVGVLAWLFYKLSTEDEERQRLLDLAHERGVELSDARAARAAAAGTTQRLRERLGDRDS